MQLFKSLSILSLLSSAALAFPLTINFGPADAGLEENINDGVSMPGLFNSKTLPGEKPIPGDSPVAICDIYEPKILNIDEVIIDPNPPQKGANLSFSAQGSLKKTIEDGAYVVVNVRYGYIKLLEKTFDLCEEIQNVDLTCPVDAGKQEISKTVEIPAEVPPGKYTVYARAFTAEDEYITCLTATVTFTADQFSMLDYAKFAKRWVMGF